MQILIIKIGAIGDVIRTTSILPGLKDKFQACEIDWLTKDESFDVLKNNNFISKIFLINDKSVDGIKSNEYDLIINLDDDLEACRLASEINHKKIVGAYLDGTRAYTDDSAAWFDMGLISRFGKEKADLLKTKSKKTYQEIIYQILDLDYKKQEPILILNKEELEFGKNFVEKNGINENDTVIGINTGAGGRWQDKKLSIEETAELIDKLNQINGKNIKLLLFGGPEEKERNEKINRSVKTDIIDASCDNSLMEFASLVNLCNGLVTSDSLAMHIGTALKKKIVAFFYPTSADEIELYGRGIKIIGEGKDYCSYKTKCDFPPKWDVENFINAAGELIE